MVMRRGKRWCAALGLWGGAIGAWAQPSAAGAETSLGPKVHHYYVECHNPDTELCAVQSPDTSLYTVLTPGISFDDLMTHWVVDLRQFPAAKGAVKTLRVASTSGEVHAIHMKLVYDKASLARAARKPVSATASVASSPVTASTPATAAVSTAAKPGGGLGQGAVMPSDKSTERASAAAADPVSSSGYVVRTGQGGVPNTALSPSAASSTKPPIKPAAPSEASKSAGQAASSIPDATVTVPPPCLDGICLGASIQTLNAPFEAVMTLGEQLRSGLSSNGKLPPNAEESFKRMEALYRMGDKDGLEKEAETWPSSNYGRDQLFKNLFHLVQAYELAEQALGGKRNADTVALAMYFVPQPVNRKNGVHGTVNIKAYPMAFATGSSLHFDQGLPKLLAKTKPMFCGAFRLEGHYESKSGYPTTVTVQTDSDGDFKVITMQRLFMNASRDSVQQLHGELAQRYASVIKADIATLKMDGTRIQLSFMHPIMFQGVGVGADEASKLFLAFWQQGWMEFKGKNAGLLGAMNTITNHNKSSIAACKPKVLSLD